jgi:hypothetical protein
MHRTQTAGGGRACAAALALPPHQAPTHSGSQHNQVQELLAVSKHPGPAEAVLPNT